MVFSADHSILGEFMNTYDISFGGEGFNLSIDGEIMLIGVEKISDILEAVSEILDKETVKKLSFQYFSACPQYPSINKTLSPLLADVA